VEPQQYHLGAYALERAVLFAIRRAIPPVKPQSIVGVKITIFDLRDDLTFPSGNLCDLPKTIWKLGWEVYESVFESHDEDNKSNNQQQNNARKPPREVSIAPEV